MNSNIERWQFWIDVGGTFTDCLARAPDGQNFKTKVLSSGIAKGSIGTRATNGFTDPGRRDEPDEFWIGANVRFLDADGKVVGNAVVTGFQTGQFGCSESVPNDSQTYELDPGLAAPLLAIREISKLPLTVSLPPADVFLGTTRGTNALLTRTGAKTAFVTTAGIRDLLLIGDQARPHLFKLSIEKPKPLYSTAIEIEERILFDGTVELAPDVESVKRKLESLKQIGIQSLAVCLMHGYKFPQHEQLVEEIAKEVGFDDCRLSSDVAPLIKILPRAETTVLDAYLNPVLRNYIDDIQAELGDGSELRLMTSAGGLVSRQRFSGKDSVLSGPAGGVVGAARVAQQIGISKVIGFDMGGTSTDVCRFDGEFEHDYESRKAGVRIVAPMLAIETVAAGGGSICWFDGVRMMVGPDSAGAHPGPACYGNGGPLAVTDINLFLGRIDEHHFPFQLNRDAVETRLQHLTEEIEIAWGRAISTVELAEGFLKIANNKMALAIRNVSVAKGYDPRDYALVAFGGAGSQHSCAVAAELGIESVLEHPESSILSAVGISLAEETADAAMAVLETYSSETVKELESDFQAMESKLRQQLESDGCESERIEIEHFLDLRYRGTANAMTISRPADSDFLRAFCHDHQRQFGYLQDADVEVFAARVRATARGKQLEQEEVPDMSSAANSDGTHEMIVNGTDIAAAKFDRDRLKSGQLITGPAIVANDLSTVLVDPGWSAKVLRGGQILMSRANSDDVDHAVDANETDEPDPVTLEIFNNHFSSIAEQMGISLRKTSISVNVKERLDFSCAIFTKDGDLVVNAPHIPVHLGAMSETVRHLIEANRDKINPGDFFVTNDPYAGGSHLPDVTVATPVFDFDQKRLIFWLASRSHHSEIGGMAPGSMPAHATNLSQEGVLIQNFKVVDSGRSRFDELRELLVSGEFPSRSPDENLADIRAQIAANKTGENALLSLVRENSLSFVLRQMKFVQDAAERKARLSLSKIPDGRYEFSDQLDNGNTIHVAIENSDGRLVVDFAGTSPVSADNLNANKAIVSSAVMYVMRCLIDDDIPLNEGVMKPVEIRLPDCFLNPTPGPTAESSPAIVGGNVETSQRIVDVLLGALNLAAASQGTMNNWLIGDSTFGYYETVGGGGGATCDSPGADSIHCHMSNTRLTDPEILETRYPLILRCFAVRQNSGGSGQFAGGNGMVREVEFTKPVVLSLLTSRRSSRPFGLEGGQAGVSGINMFISKDGTTKKLGSTCETHVLPNDRLRLETPGGGGFGPPTI